MTVHRWAGTNTNMAATANWSTSALPTNGDTVYFHDSTQAVVSGTNFATVVLDSIYFDKSYSGTADVSIQSAQWHIGRHDGFGNPPGSYGLTLDIGTTVATVTVYDSANNSDSAYIPPVRLSGGNAGSVLNVRKGSVGMGVEYPGQTAAIGDVNIDYVTNRSGDARVQLAAGVTLSGDIEKSGGTLYLNCSANTVVNRAGDLWTDLDAGIASLEMKGGNAVLNASGTITAATAEGGTLDFTRNSEARTVSALTVHPGAVVKYNPDVVTVTSLAFAEPVSLRVEAV